MNINHIDQLIKEGAFILDVRESFEYELGHISSSTLIPLGELKNRLHELPEDQTIYVYCQHGKRSEKARDLLKLHQRNAISLEGGFASYTGEYKQINQYKTEEKEVVELKENRIKVEASGLQCPGPLLKVNEIMNELKHGEQMEITVTDFGFCTDIEAWARKTGQIVVKNEQHENKVIVVLQKNEKKHPVTNQNEAKDGATIVVFSGDLDKALASFIIATGAKSMGKDVTMFFTFWGLNIIKDRQAPKKKKNGLDRLFSMMMPKSAEHLPISKMNMAGLGSKMIQFVMKKKRVDPLTEMIKKAEQLGVKMVACSMSMDIMAIEREELLASVEIGGVGTYLGDTEQSNLNLFI